MTIHQPQSTYEPTDGTAAMPDDPPIEGNDPFGMRRFSLSRYSVRHMLMMLVTAGILCAITGRAVWAQDWFVLTLSAAGLALISLVMLLMARMVVRRVIVEQWIRRLGMGDFDYTVEPWGNDELSKCCVALEALRLKAIEAMQLDLVRSLSDELQHKNEELERTLEELRRTQDQMVSRQKLAELGELSAGVAHEIRNPLTFIKNFAQDADSVTDQMLEMLDKSASEATREQRHELNSLAGVLKEDMERVVRNTERADRVVSDMLAMHRGSSGEFVPVDVNQLIRQQAMVAYRTVQSQTEGFTMDVRMDLDPEIGLVRAVPEDLGRVITNLVVNACQAAAAKSGELGAGDYEPVLSLATRRAPDAVEIRVWDNGHGISRTVQERMFNPFFTTKGPNQGTGLGLSLVHDVVREHGGNVEVDSRPGEYTEMLVRLPMSRAPAAEDDGRPLEPEPSDVAPRSPSA